MANWVFKLKGLGAAPPIVLQLGLNDAATTRALDRHRRTPEGGSPETDEQVAVRLWLEWFQENVLDVEYRVRKDAAVAAAAADINKATPTVSETET